MSRFHKTLAASVATILSVTAVSVAQASFHLWQIDEAYSNPSGTVQFVELFTNSGGQEFTQGQSFSSNGHSFTIPTNLPGDTLNDHFILATPGYFALTGVPKADYNLGVNNFFNKSGDTLNWAFVNSLTFTAGQLPLDGLNSLNRAFNPPTSTTFTVARNSPTNFAGQVGVVPEPSTLVLGVIGFAALATMMRRRLRR